MKEILKCKAVWGLLIFVLAFAYIGSSPIYSIEEEVKEIDKTVISMNNK
ncbi:MAG: hypothetical protein PHO63_03545 [Bacilli bacterium]|nr:hypothetical protein [Bacilli bacterium]MDD4809179.1 hypothetical protein [Bacilli bacterium]